MSHQRRGGARSQAGEWEFPTKDERERGDPRHSPAEFCPLMVRLTKGEKRKVGPSGKRYRKADQNV